MVQSGLKKALPLLSVAVLLTVAGLLLYFWDINKNVVLISHDSGIYGEEISLNLHIFRKGKIFYTTDGHAPDAGYTGTKEYTEPIVLSMGEDTATYGFQFRVFYEDGSCSEIYKRDYILDTGGTERFTTTYVVSVTGNEEGLFGDEGGIFARGNMFYEYMAENPDVNVISTVVPANYYSGVEVPVHASIFLQDGTQIIDQNCGIRIYGNYTRQHNQKSFKLKARYEYDSVNEFAYPFFQNLYSDAGGTLMDEFETLSFHNSGTDHDFGYGRTELVEELARQSGYGDLLAAESVTVYINGKYQGVYWLQNSYDDRYFEEKYGDYNGEMAVLEGTLGHMFSYDYLTAGQQESAAIYNDFKNWITSADMSDDGNWQRVCDTFDIDNFARYFAIEYYTGNHDWPQNNVKVYRYATGNPEDYKEGTVFDGRFRFLLFDLDYSFGLKFVDKYGQSVDSKRLEGFATSEGSTVLFSKMMQRKEFRELFLGYLMAMMNITFQSQHVEETLNEMNALRLEELRYMMEETDFLAGSYYEAYGVGLGGMQDTQREWENIVTYANQRPDVVIEELQEVFSCGREIPLTVLPERGRFYLCNIPMNNAFGGRWLEDVPIVIRGEHTTGYFTEGYYVNDVFYEGIVLNLYPWEIKGWKEGITIVPVIGFGERESLEIAEYRLDGSEDYVVLENTGTKPVKLEKYSLSDKEGYLSKGHLPGIVLQPGEQFAVYGKNYTGERDKKSMQLSFSWSSGERLYLYSQTGELLEVCE